MATVIKKNPANIKLEKLNNFLLLFNRIIPAKLLIIPIIENITGNKLLELHLLNNKFTVIIGIRNMKIKMNFFNIQFNKSYSPTIVKQLYLHYIHNM